MQEFNLSEIADKKPCNISGGEQQRVAIARSIANRPQVLLADEPTGNLDTATSEEVMSLISTMNQNLNTTFLIVTHDPDIAARCRRSITMNDGVITADQQAIETEEE